MGFYGFKSKRTRLPKRTHCRRRIGRAQHGLRTVKQGPASVTKVRSLCCALRRPCYTVTYYHIINFLFPNMFQ
ncbi:MAG: hypothetical protein RLZZ157_268 [Pseudomonadota bacterium]|jgi:hypothetical protein